MRARWSASTPAPKTVDVNVTREKKLTNMRSSTADVFETLARPLELDLEQAMEFCAGDECVEVAPEIVRVRKGRPGRHDAGAATGLGPSRQRSSTDPDNSSRPRSAGRQASAWPDCRRATARYS